MLSDIRKINTLERDFLKSTNHKHQKDSLARKLANVLGKCYQQSGQCHSQSLLLVSDVIGAWLSSNRLRLNPGRTQFIWVGGRVQLSKIDLSILLERFPGVLFSTTVRDLGVTLD